EIRHVHDLLSTVYKAKPPLYTLVERAHPGFERESLAFLQTGATTRVFQALHRRVDEKLRAGLSLPDFAAWGLGEADLRANLAALDRALASGGAPGGNALRRL